MRFCSVEYLVFTSRERDAVTVAFVERLCTCSNWFILELMIPIHSNVVRYSVQLTNSRMRRSNEYELRRIIYAHIHIQTQLSRTVYSVRRSSCSVYSCAQVRRNRCHNRTKTTIYALLLYKNKTQIADAQRVCFVIVFILRFLYLRLLIDIDFGENFFIKDEFGSPNKGFLHF